MEFKCLATAISSLPFKDARKACEVVFRYLPDIPAWPQLPAIGFRENMYAQLSGKVPGLKLVEEDKKIVFETEEDNNSEMEKFYENVISGNVEYFSIEEEFAAGLYEFVSVLKKDKGLRSKVKYLKGHITGPVSFGMTITDTNRKAVFYNEQYRDIVVKNCAMKAKWQVRFLRKETGLKDVIIFIDEPYMASFGSSFMAVRKEDVISGINEVVQGIHSENALAGIHCCGNTDWSVLLSAGADILSFDAYNYIESIMLYPETLTKHFSSGCTLSWGIVPSSAEIRVENLDSLASKLINGISSLSRKGIDREIIMKNCLLTPSCGLGTLGEDNANSILKLNYELSERMRSGIK